MDGAGEVEESRGREDPADGRRRPQGQGDEPWFSAKQGIGGRVARAVSDSDRGDEVALLHGHREIDRVEVDFATEAAAEIRRRVDRRVALVAAGTQEYQLPVAEFVRPLQLPQERCPGNVIA